VAPPQPVTPVPPVEGDPSPGPWWDPIAGPYLILTQMIETRSGPHTVRVRVWSCPLCGSLVADTDLHRARCAQ
jgi:hypothetical protein